MSSDSENEVPREMSSDSENEVPREMSSDSENEVPREMSSDSENEVPGEMSPDSENEDDHIYQPPSSITAAQVLFAAKRQRCIIDKTTIEIVNSLFDGDEDSFVALEREITNSCKKNKEKLFDEEKQAVSDTPRRETYTVESPSSDIQTLKKVDQDQSLNVTITRGSEKKIRKSKRKVSFVTPLRRSTRISAATPQYNSVKDRPKTPMPSRLSSAKKQGSFPIHDHETIACNLNLDVSENADSKISGGKKRPSTPMPLSKQKRRKASSSGDSHNVISTGFESTPKVMLPLKKLEEEEDLSEVSPISRALPNTSNENKREALDIPSEKTKLKSSETPSTPQETRVKRSDASKAIADKKATPLLLHSTKDVAVQTPGFRRTSRGNTKTTPYFTPHSSKKSAITTPGFKKIPNRNEKITPLLRCASSRKVKITQGSRRVATPVPSSKKIPTPGSKRVATPVPSSKKTPNFNKIHQKNFDKMESIDDYQQRKLRDIQKKLQEQQNYRTPSKSNDLKKQVAEKKMKNVPKTFSGIPFVPTAPSTRTTKNQLKNFSSAKTKTLTSAKSKFANESTLTEKKNAGNSKIIKRKENTPLKQKPKFDLRASLAKKLPYKPHTGPLKPMTDGNMNKSMNISSLHSLKTTETENQVIKANRIQSREVLQGVRKNKRFLLQMTNRQMNMSMQ